MNGYREITAQSDTLVVWRLDRLGRSLDDLIRLTNERKSRRALSWAQRGPTEKAPAQREMSGSTLGGETTHDNH
jgi:DNA invertase Pin-like site-specific DNA recombinase